MRNFRVQFTPIWVDLTLTLACYPEGVVCFSEIYQVTGPVERFAGQIASQGYVVGEQYIVPVSLLR